jgi:hypothetical protein
VQRLSSQHTWCFARVGFFAGCLPGLSGQREMQISSRVPMRRTGRSTAAVPVASATSEHPATKLEPLRLSAGFDSGNILIKEIKATSALLEIATDPYCATDDAHHYQVRRFL